MTIAKVIDWKEGTTSVPLIGVTGGDGVIAIVRWNNNTSSITSILCDGAAMTLIGSPFYNAALTTSVQFAYISTVVGTGNKTITMTFDSSPLSCNTIAASFSGGLTSGFYEASTLATASGNSAGPATVAVTTGFDNDMIITFVANDAGAKAGVSGSGYAAILNEGAALANSTWYESGEYNVDVSTAGVKNPAMTLGGSGHWMIAAAAFKAAVGGGGGGRGALLASQRNRLVIT